MYWFFTPPFWMDDINSGVCDVGTGFVDTGWELENNPKYQYEGRGSGLMSVATFNTHGHDMDDIEWGDSEGDGNGDGWPV